MEKNLKIRMDQGVFNVYTYMQFQASLKNPVNGKINRQNNAVIP